MNEPSEASLRTLVTQIAHSRAEWGEALGDVTFVEPTADYFPDEFALTPDGVETLLERMRSYAPLSEDLPLALAFTEGEAEAGGSCGTGGCGTGACQTGDGSEIAGGGMLHTDDGYALVVPVSATKNPVLLTGALARAIGLVVLAEAGEEPETPAERAALGELAAVSIGLGTLLLGASCVYAKSCGGVKASHGTVLSTEELAWASVMALHANGARASVVRRHLETTQREAFDAATRWLDDRPTLAAQLREAPELLAAGAFDLAPEGGSLLRLWKRKPDALAAPAPEARRPRSPEEERRLAEARALVDEALAE